MLLNSRLKDRKPLKLIIDFLPVTRAEVMPVLAGLNPGGEDWWIENILFDQDDNLPLTEGMSLKALRNFEIIHDLPSNS